MQANSIKDSQSRDRTPCESNKGAKSLQKFIYKMYRLKKGLLK